LNAELAAFVVEGELLDEDCVLEGELPDEEDEVELPAFTESVALAAAWKSSKLFSAVGLTANTIPIPQ